MLAPLDEALQMRPQLRHLDESKKATKDEDMLDEEEKKPSFVTVGPLLCLAMTLCLFLCHCCTPKS